MTVKLLTEHNLEFLSLKGGCTGLSESTLVKMPHCWKSNVHTCHKLWTESCEIKQNFKGDLIKFCEIFTKITLELPQNNQKAFILM